MQLYTPLSVLNSSLSGRLHTVNIVVCSCEKQNVTFMRHQLWASSVENPSVAYHIDLLQWMQYLVLEAKMSLLAICQAIRWKNDLSVSQVSKQSKWLVCRTFACVFRNGNHVSSYVGTGMNSSRYLCKWVDCIDPCFDSKWYVCWKIHASIITGNCKIAFCLPIRTCCSQIWKLRAQWFCWNMPHTHSLRGHSNTSFVHMRDQKMEKMFVKPNVSNEHRD